MRRPTAALLLLLVITGTVAIGGALLLVPAHGPQTVYRLVSFARLDGWGADTHAAALPAFQRSCAAFDRLPADRPIGPHGLGGVAGDWREVCGAAMAIAPGDHAAARAFFERHFTPVAVSGGGRRGGLFTGYYEPLLNGSLDAHPDYPVPLYRRPPELVTVDLGRFRDDLAGRRIAGSVSDGRLRPFASRRQIDAGALDRRGLELVWVDDPVAAFFLHIQGSGRVRLADGTLLRVGYDGPNGHPYTAIGRVLIARGALEAEDVSLQTIRAWLQANPDAAAEVMAANASYVFFRQLDGDGPVGAQGVALTPGRSLAVDRTVWPLGAPVWLDSAHPHADEPQTMVPLRRLMVAQDTGGAIRGAVRGDVFWGPGADAEIIAGHMKSPGRYVMLLPRAVAQRVFDGRGVVTGGALKEIARQAARTDRGG